jgi:hypothetical protein
MEIQYLILIVGVVMALGVALYLYLEYQARTLRTRIVDVPGGLRFEAHSFSIEVQRSNKQLAVISRTGRMVRTPLDKTEAHRQVAPLKVLLPAAGLTIEALRPTKDPMAQGTPISAGFCTLRLSATDAPGKDTPPLPGGHLTEVNIERVPDIVAVSFENFAARVRVWIEKIEHRLETERIAHARKETETAQAAEIERELVAAQASMSATGPLTDQDREGLAALQIAKWRQAAGFTGTATEVSIDAEGRVSWFVDMLNDGRITLHADKRTIHANLVGATVASLGGEVEIGVRDYYWTEDEPALRTFRVFKGMPPDARRAWKERIELVRDSITKAVHRGP